MKVAARLYLTVILTGSIEIQLGSREILDSMVAANNTTKENQERMREVRALLETYRIFTSNRAQSTGGGKHQPIPNK
mgnify:CR=1 FL=1